MRNAHLIEATYVPPSNTRGARVKLKSIRFGDAITLSYDYAIGNIREQATKYLKAAGYDLICFGETEKGYIIASDTFESLKSSKLSKKHPLMK